MSMEQGSSKKMTGEVVGGISGFVLGGMCMPALVFGVTASAAFAAAGFVIGAVGGAYGGAKTGQKLSEKNKEKSVEEK